MKKLFPVIHYISLATTKENLKICINEGCHGVFLINMHQDDSELNESLILAREMGGKDFMVGVNRLGCDNETIAEYIKHDKLVDAYWVDNPGLSTDLTESSVYMLTKALNERKNNTPNFEFYGSVAFKTQKKESKPWLAAKIAKTYRWIPTTSGIGTGIAADYDKIESMKNAIEDYPLAIASGITPENIDLYLPAVDHFLVATGISKDFYNFDRVKVFEIVKKIYRWNEKHYSQS